MLYQSWFSHNYGILKNIMNTAVTNIHCTKLSLYMGGKRRGLIWRGPVPELRVLAQTFSLCASIANSVLNVFINSVAPQ